MSKKKDDTIEASTVSELDEAKVDGEESTCSVDAEHASESDEAVNAEVPEEIDPLEEIKAELQRAQEDMLRAAAEAQNARRRADQDVEKARKFALERFVADLLPVVDNLERAMSTIDQDDDALKSVYEGIELTYKSFQDSLGRHQVMVVDPMGEPFDPEVHQAMSMVPNADVEPNTVIDVFQKGYVLNGRLVRPAMVVVAKSAD